MTKASSEQNKSRLLPWIGAEHTLVAVTLLALGIVLLANLHAHLGKDITSLAKYFGVDPASNGIQSLIGSAHKLTPGRLSFYGIVAVAYGALEAVEGYGLIRRRRWGEYLTVVATTLLFIPEVDELITKVSLLKLALLALNVAVIIYLGVHLRRTRAHRDQPPGKARGDRTKRSSLKSAKKPLAIWSPMERFGMAGAPIEVYG